MKPWCIGHRDGWCAASAQSRPPKAGQMEGARTRCGHYIMGNYGVVRRTPTCPDCLAKKVKK